MREEDESNLFDRKRGEPNSLSRGAGAVQPSGGRGRGAVAALSRAQTNPRR